MATSATSGVGVDGLRRYLADHRTAAFVGSSGAGKSSLANRLAGADALATAAVRAGDDKGRHATTARRLVVLPGGGVLLDTPGLRALGLRDAPGGLERAFADVEEHAAGCRFGDCRHAGVPGCAVAGAIDEERLPNRRALADEVGAAERKRRAKVAQRAMRKMPPKR